MIRPGSTIGIIGNGQLGRLMSLEARKMGYKVAVYAEGPGPGADGADHLVTGEPHDEASLERFARLCDVVTFENEQIDAFGLRCVERFVPTFPSAGSLAIVSDRLLQREMIARVGIPQTPFASVASAADLDAAAEAIGFPAVLKRRQGGYDGRSQAKVEDRAALGRAWATLGEKPCVLEAFVPFDREISAIVARRRDGHVVAFPVAENDHQRHILHTSRVPARITPAVAEVAVERARAIAHHLEHVGVLTAELFAFDDGRLLVNEIALRVHNSGHYTLGACATSQFEQHVRAICDLPLGATTLLRPCTMVNLLGDLWAKGEPDWTTALAAGDVTLVLYGKAEARPGRKMGHLLVRADSADAAHALGIDVLARLRPAG